MPKSQSAIKCIRRNMKNKKEDEKQKKALRQMGHDAAQPRAPAASVAKMRRKLKKQKKKQNDEPDESSSSKDHAPPKKAAAMKRQLEQHEAAESPPKKAARDAGMPVVNRGDEKALSVLEMMDAVPSQLPGANKERIVQHRVRTLLANLSKASREKQFPATLVLGKKKASSEKKAPPRFKNVGAEIVKVCLSQPVWALVHRRDFNRGLDEWFETSDKLMRLLDCGDADDINAAMKAAVTRQIDDAMKERVFFEILSNVCNNLFKTRVLANKKFDANFVTIATYNTDPVVRSLSIPKYFRALKENVWQKITDCVDLLTGGADMSAISQLEACAEYVIRRAKSKPVEATIKKAVELATQADKLCTGAFIPTTKENKKQFNKGYHDPYLYYYHHHFYPPTYYAPPPLLSQMPPPPPPPAPSRSDAPTAAAPVPPAATPLQPTPNSLPSAAPTAAAELAPPAPSVDGDGAPPPPKTPVPKTPSFSPKSYDLSPPRYCTPSPLQNYSLETPSTPGRDLELKADLTRFSAADYQLFTPSSDEEFEEESGEYISDEFC